MILLNIGLTDTVGFSSNGFGIFCWLYTAWKMYRRDNVSLALFYKILFWLKICIFSGILVLKFYNSEYRRYMEEVPVDLIMGGWISIIIDGGLLYYFRRQLIDISNVSTVVESDIYFVSDECWQAAAAELDSNKNEAVWAKSFAMSEGDEAKSKAMYIKIRALDLMGINNNISIKKSINKKSSGIKNLISKIGTFSHKTNIILFLVFACGFFIILTREEKNPAAKPVSISVKRGASSNDYVTELSRGIKDGTVLSKYMIANIIENDADVFYKSWYKYGYKLPESTVASIEAENIWWVSNGKLYIRLYNPSDAALVGFNLLMIKSDCTYDSETKILTNFNIKHAPLKPYSYGVFYSNLPFDYKKNFGSGVNCGIITTAIAKL